MLVWKAISSIVLIIFSISLELSVISSMAVIISCIFWFPSASWRPIPPTCSRARWTLSAVCLTLTVTELIVSSNSSTAPLCSIEPWLSAWAALDICSAPPETYSALVTIWPIVVLSFWRISFKDVRIEAKSPTYSWVICAVRSPPAMLSSTLDISPI